MSFRSLRFSYMLAWQTLHELLYISPSVLLASNHRKVGEGAVRDLSSDVIRREEGVLTFEIERGLLAHRHRR